MGVDSDLKIIAGFIYWDVMWRFHRPFTVQQRHDYSYFFADNMEALRRLGLIK